MRTLAGSALVIAGLAACPAPKPSAPIANVSEVKAATPRERLLAVTPHLLVSVGQPARGSLSPAEIEERLREADARIVRVSMMFTGVGYTDDFRATVQIAGYEPAALADMHLDRYLVGGKLDLEGREHGASAVVGTGVAKRFGLEVGSEITLSIGPATSTRFHVNGIFEVGIDAYDTNVMFVHVEDAEHGQGIPLYAIQVADPALAKDVKGAIESAHLDQVWRVPVTITEWQSSTR